MSEQSFAQQVIEKIREQTGKLAADKWPEIDQQLTDDEEIKITFTTKVTHRKTQPGEHADKSDMIRTTIGFASRVTASIESTLEDANQPDLFNKGQQPESPDDDVPL